MDLQALRWFQAVVDGETVTETARRANITQPVVTRTLARSEKEVGVPLLHRNGRRLQPKPAGRLFKEYVDTVLARWDDGLRAVSDFVAPSTGVVPLGFMHTYGTWLVPELISGYCRVHPGARFDLRQDADPALIDTLRAGVVDLAVTGPAPEVPGLRWRPLLTEPLLLPVPPGHRLAGRQDVRLAEVADEPFVVLRTGMGLRTIVAEACREAGFEPRIAFEGDEVAALRGLVGAGLGVSLLPRQQQAPPEAGGPGGSRRPGRRRAGRGRRTPDPGDQPRVHPADRPRWFHRPPAAARLARLPGPCAARMAGVREEARPYGRILRPN